jgi:exosome complex exonuclease RRP6
LHSILIKKNKLLIMSTPSTSPDIATLLAALQSQLSSINNVTAQLPDAADLQFEKTLSRSFAKKMNNEADNVLSLINNLLNWADGSQQVVDGEMIREGVYNDVIQRVEGLLEGADDGIEKHLGVGKVVKNIAVGAKAFDAASATIAGSNGSAKPPLPSHILNDPNLPRPQLLFTPRTVLTCTQLPLDPTTIDEQDPVIWQPILQTKRHAKDSTASWLKTEVVVPVPETSRWNEVTRTRYMHPYSDELSTLEPPATYYLVPETPAPTVPTSFQTTPFTWVDNLETLESMIEDIRSVGIECDEAGKGKELAIDLEHHDYRTWGGITCLIQVRSSSFDVLTLTEVTPKNS